MKKIAVLISGSGTNLQAIINKCLSGYIDAEIVCVLSNDPCAYGIKRAKSHDIKTKIINSKDFETNNLFNEDLYNYLKTLDLDLIVLAGFMKILSSRITKAFYGKIINIHPSLLPRYPGLDTHKKVIKNKDSLHGVSVHYVSEELDAGPLIAQGAIKTYKDEDIDDLIERIHQIEHIIYPEVIKFICKKQIYLDSNKIVYKNINTNNKDFIYKNYEI
jgi:phosphoribosylglycinamide formyltransferase-1